MIKIGKATFTFRGWPGHFISGYECHFRLNTLVEVGREKAVVSTVGLLPIPGRLKESFLWKKESAVGFVEIGLNRYFETMAFRAKKEGKFWTHPKK